MSQSPGTKPRRRNRHDRRRAAVHGTLTYTETQRARRQAIEARRRQFAVAGRHPHTTRDTTRSAPPTIGTRLVRDAAAIVDADPDLVDWVTDRLAARHRRPGRPRELHVRTALICYLLQVLVHRHFLLSHLPETLATMSWRTRRNLGIDYLRNGQPTQVTYNQLLDLFHDLADCFDAWDDRLDELDPADADTERRQRADDLQTFVDRLVAASTHNAPMWKGNAGLDATLKWSHERPRSVTLNSKVERRGVDGDAGPAVPLSAVVDADDDAAIDHDVFAPVAPADTPDDRECRERRRRNWPRTWSHGSRWVGRANKTKSVHGIALHSVVRGDSDEPCLVEGLTVTPANGDPVDAVVPLLRRIHDQRAADPAVVDAAAAGNVLVMGDVVADPAYTVTGDRWHLPIKALGGTPIGRLHRTNQEKLIAHTVERGSRRGEVLTMGGRPVCECVRHTPLADLHFPKFPYTTAQLAAYQRRLAPIADFEWSPNGAPRANGSRQWLSPHGANVGPDGAPGGCEHCTTADGPVIDETTGRPVARCCTARSRIIPAAVTALDAGVTHGSPEWYERWNRRNRVEGSYGVLKNLAVVNWSRAFHHFVGLARETLVAAFAVVAYNVHMLGTWTAKQRLTADVDPDDGLPSPQPTATAPAAAAAGDTPARRRGPKGLEWLAEPDGDPPDTT